MFDYIRVTSHLVEQRTSTGDWRMIYRIIDESAYREYINDLIKLGYVILKIEATPYGENRTYWAK